jgi:hypothetical protein
MIETSLTLPIIIFFNGSSTAMQTSAPAKDTVVTTVRMPRDMHDWLKQRAAYFGGSPNAELIRCGREAMERKRADAGKDRTTAAPE